MTPAGSHLMSGGYHARDAAYVPGKDRLYICDPDRSTLFHTWDAATGAAFTYEGGPALVDANKVTRVYYCAAANLLVFESATYLYLVDPDNDSATVATDRQDRRGDQTRRSKTPATGTSTARCWPGQRSTKLKLSPPYSIAPCGGYRMRIYASLACDSYNGLIFAIKTAASQVETLI